MPTVELADRTLGQYPLSIATSLALESANGIHPEIPVTRPPIDAYDELWINVRTLFRNLLGALDTQSAKSVSADQLCDALKDELGLIVELIATQTNSRVKVVYYISDYAGIEAKYRHAVIRRDSTDKQRQYTALLTATFDRLLKEVEPGSIRLFPLKLKRPEHDGVTSLPKALIVTHIAYDLFSYRIFSKLDLLESHTGKIKDRSLWYTKYYSGKELSMIPFREDLVQVFGDNETFRTFDPAVRRELIEIATKYKWSAVTTYAKIHYGVSTMKNPYSRAIVLEILSSAY